MEVYVFCVHSEESRAKPYKVIQVDVSLYKPNKSASQIKDADVAAVCEDLLRCGSKESLLCVDPANVGIPV